MTKRGSKNDLEIYSVVIAFVNYTRSLPKNLNIQINNKKVKRVTSCKYLGLMIDQNLGKNDHKDFVVKNI